MKDIIDLMKDERGQGMAEYGLIIALVAIVVIVAFTTLGTKLKAKFDEVNKTLK